MEFKPCSRFTYSNHVFLQMAERINSSDEVEAVANRGEVITAYENEQPFPCFLVIGWVKSVALHVVFAQNPTDALCVVVTAYWPDPEKWSTDCKTRLKR